MQHPASQTPLCPRRLRILRKKKRKKEKWGWRERTNTELSSFRVQPSGVAAAVGGGSTDNGNTRLPLLCTCPHARLLLALICLLPVILQHMWAHRDAARTSASKYRKKPNEHGKRQHGPLPSASDNEMWLDPSDEIETQTKIGLRVESFSCQTVTLIVSRWS